MEKIVISVLGTDRPGIVAAVSRILVEHQCNVEDVSQTILQGEFVGILIASVPLELSIDMREELEKALAPLGLRVLVKPLEETRPPFSTTQSEPFVVVTTGPDRLGLVAEITQVMADFGVNISQLKAVFRGGDDPNKNTMIYEVDVPLHIDHRAFRNQLLEKARELDLVLSFQHRDIFEAIHRI